MTNNLSENTRNNDRQSGERTLPNDPKRFVFERIYKWVGINYGNMEKVALDYGCGAGFGSSLLSGYFKKTYAVDVSPETIAVCQSTFGNDHLQFGVISEDSIVPFPIQFDMIFSFQVIEHIPLHLIDGYLKSIYAALNSNGVAVITTPNSNNYFGGHSGFEFHIKEYTAQELSMLVQKAVKNCNYEIKGVQDIRSTRVRNLIRKLGKNSFLSNAIASVIGQIMFLIERTFPAIIDFCDSYIIEGDVADVSGSLMIIIKK